MGKRKSKQHGRAATNETILRKPARKYPRAPRVYPDGMVAADGEVRRLIGRLRLSELADACEDFQLIREATFSEAGGLVDQWSLRLIKQVARETRRKCYGALLKAIANAVQHDEKGVRAAHLTAGRALELIVLHTRFDYITSEQTAGAVRDLLNARRIKPQSHTSSLRVVPESSSPNPPLAVESKHEESESAITTLEVRTRQND